MTDNDVKKLDAEQPFIGMIYGVKVYGPSRILAMNPDGDDARKFGRMILDFQRNLACEMRTLVSVTVR
jgi:hypothetical protein